MLIFVRFDRNIEEDISIARENFPHLEFDPRLQLLEQFKLELNAKKELLGLWEIVGYHDTGSQPNDRQHIWAKFVWQRNLKEFINTLQEAFDNEDINGFWSTVDASDKDGPVSRKQFMKR